jgi:hypothetical protein
VKRWLLPFFSQPIQAFSYFGLANKKVNEFTLAGKRDEEGTENNSEQPLTREKKHDYSSQDKNNSQAMTKNRQNYRADRGGEDCSIVKMQPKKTILGKPSYDPWDKNKAEAKSNNGKHGEPSQKRL